MILINVGAPCRAPAPEAAALAWNNSQHTGKLRLYFAKGESFIECKSVIYTPRESCLAFGLFTVAIRRKYIAQRAPP